MYIPAQNPQHYVGKAWSFRLKAGEVKDINLISGVEVIREFLFVRRIKVIKSLHKDVIFAGVIDIGALKSITKPINKEQDCLHSYVDFVVYDSKESVR